MPEAPRDSLSDRSPTRPERAEEQTTRSGGARTLEGVSSHVLELGGFGLLAYATYSIVRTVLSGDAGVGPEASLGRMSELVGLFPVLLLGPVLIFAPQAARRKKGFWKGVVRWLVFLQAVMFLLFVPLAFLNQYSVVQADANQVQRFEVLLAKRKQEIMRAVKPLESPAEFTRTLSTFPEITQANINPAQTPDQIRQGIRDGIDRGIKAEVTQLKARQRMRQRGMALNVRSVAAGSLIAGLSLFSLASWLLPWLNPAGKALTYTANGIGNTLMTLPRQWRRWKPGQRLGRNLAQWRKRRGGRAGSRGRSRR